MNKWSNNKIVFAKPIEVDIWWTPKQEQQLIQNEIKNWNCDKNIVGVTRDEEEEWTHDNWWRRVEAQRKARGYNNRRWEARA